VQHMYRQGRYIGITNMQNRNRFSSIAASAELRRGRSRIRRFERNAFVASCGIVWHGKGRSKRDFSVDSFVSFWNGKGRNIEQYNRKHDDYLGRASYAGTVNRMQGGYQLQLHDNIVKEDAGRVGIILHCKYS
jgi:hypothetical protein